VIGGIGKFTSVIFGAVGTLLSLLLFLNSWSNLGTPGGIGWWKNLLDLLASGAGFLSSLANVISTIQGNTNNWVVNVLLAGSAILNGADAFVRGVVDKVQTWGWLGNALLTTASLTWQALNGPSGEAVSAAWNAAKSFFSKLFSIIFSGSLNNIFAMGANAIDSAIQLFANHIQTDIDTNGPGTYCQQWWFQWAC
jgi:hypothetical protein